jgi:hypothetical protein
MSSSELRNRSQSSAQNANPLPLNTQINFLKCDGVIAPGVTIKHFTLNVSTLTYFGNYTDFSLVETKETFRQWYDKYLIAKNPLQNSTIAVYEPNAHISYHDSLGNKHNYVCKITNIVLNQDAPIFTFDTSYVYFYDKTSDIAVEGTIFVRNPIVNDPMVSKVDTNFLPGEYKDIRIHFDPLYDPSYDDYNIPSPMFIHSDIKMRPQMFRGGRIIGKKLFATLPIEFESRFVSYGAWSPTDVNSNQKTSVYVETLSTFTHIFEKYLHNKTDTPQDFNIASTSLEFRTRDGEIFINTFQITDCYIYRDKLIFELKGGIENGITEGLWTNVTMRIDEFPTLSSS